MKTKLFLLLTILLTLGCSKDDSISIDYIEVEKQEATIHYSDRSKKVTTSYTIPKDFYNTEDWRKRKLHINQSNVKNREIDGYFVKFYFNSGNTLFWIVK